MRIGAIQNVNPGINFGKIDPAIKENIKIDISRGQTRFFPENNLRYLENSDIFILKGNPKRGLYDLEHIDTGKVVHRGTIEHFLKFDPTEEQVWCCARRLKNMFPNNFANTKFDKMQNGENVEYDDDIYDIYEDD